MSDPTILDRMWASFRALVRAELAELGYLGAYAYEVRGSSLGFVDVEPATTTAGLPSLLRVPVMPGLLAETVTAASGAQAVVMFIGGDPTRPVCVSVSEVTEARIAGGTPAVARVDDTICLGYFLWDSVLRILYRSPPELGPLLTVYVPWGTFGSGTDLSATFLPVPTPTVPPPPGTPGTAWTGIVTTGSSIVGCA